MKDTPVACQTREPTRRETGAPRGRMRCPAAVAPNSRFPFPETEKMCKISIKRLDKLCSRAIICLSAEVPLLWRFNKLKTKRAAEI